MVSRIFLSHSSLDSRQALALKRWLVEQDPPLANEIFLDIDAAAGLQPGERWKGALRDANARCEAVVCLLSPNWAASHECKVEYRFAEHLNKQILCARLAPSSADDLTTEWYRFDLFGDGAVTAVDAQGGPPVEFATDGLFRLRDVIRGAGIGAQSFVWPPREDPTRAPYRGWQPFEPQDAAVFFGRDSAIISALDELRGMRQIGGEVTIRGAGPIGRRQVVLPAGRRHAAARARRPQLRRPGHRAAGPQPADGRHRVGGLDQHRAAAARVDDPESG
nr:toll/interleukin-1 receptor domain-containing protein [Mycolicibacterium sp. CR10]